MWIYGVETSVVGKCIHYSKTLVYPTTMTMIDNCHWPKRKARVTGIRAQDTNNVHQVGCSYSKFVTFIGSGGETWVPLLFGICQGCRYYTEWLLYYMAPFRRILLED